MKSLYESILDDEDVLIGRVKDDINNPFVILYTLYNQYKDLRKVPEQDILEVMSQIEFPNFDMLNMVINTRSDILFLNSRGDYIFRISIPYYEYENDNKIYFLFSNQRSKVSTHMGGVEKVKKYKEKLIKKFNFIQDSPNYRLYYCL